MKWRSRWPLGPRCHWICRCLVLNPVFCIPPAHLNQHMPYFTDLLPLPLVIPPKGSADRECRHSLVSSQLNCPGKCTLVVPPEGWEDSSSDMVGLGRSDLGGGGGEGQTVSSPSTDLHVVSSGILWGIWEAGLMMLVVVVWCYCSMVLMCTTAYSFGLLDPTSNTSAHSSVHEQYLLLRVDLDGSTTFGGRCIPQMCVQTSHGGCKDSGWTSLVGQLSWAYTIVAMQGRRVTLLN